MLHGSKRKIGEHFQFKTLYYHFITNLLQRLRGIAQQLSCTADYLTYKNKSNTYNKLWHKTDRENNYFCITSVLLINCCFGQLSINKQFEYIEEQKSVYETKRNHN